MNWGYWAKRIRPKGHQGHKSLFVAGIVDPGFFLFLVTAIGAYFCEAPARRLLMIIRAYITAQKENTAIVPTAKSHLLGFESKRAIPKSIKMIDATRKNHMSTVLKWRDSFFIASP